MSIKKLLITFFFFIFLLFNTSTYSYAKDFKTNYKVEYFLNSNNNKIDTEVKYHINITNLNKESYVSKFTLKFPKSFKIENVKASDDTGIVNPSVTINDSIVIDLSFNNPNKDQGGQNNFYLTFNQKNLFDINGNVWEVILPVVNKDIDENYEITVNLPASTNKKISISKPFPNSINQNIITWINPNTKTIYAVFGDTQLYDISLNYNLYNPKITRGYTDIAFPPDTVNQKMFIRSIDPVPDKTFTDDDGNFLARYILKPREKKIIKFSAIAQITAIPREDVKISDIKTFENEKKFLLNESDFWKTSQIEKYKNFKSPVEIYSYITTTFKYDYGRISKDIKRLGADYALKNPSSAVCTEFSDSFITLAREKGIYSREIQGFGYSNSYDLRPLSLVADVLHSWPQYWDSTKNLWVSVDPTWENTSGIDYFSSFDLNHLVFVIHGKEPNYPLPAGMYKINDTKDVVVEPTTQLVFENIKLDSSTSIPDNLDKNKAFKGSIKIVNNSNVFLYSIPISIKANGVKSHISESEIVKLAPFEERDINFIIDPTKTNIKSSHITISVNNKRTLEKTVYFKNNYFFYYFIIILTLIIISILFLKKIKDHRI